MLMFSSMSRNGAAGIVLAGCLAAACGGDPGPAPAEERTAPVTPPAASSSAAAPADVADIFPPGPGREQVLNNCGSCHNVACSAIGQRANGRWDGLLESHAGKVADEDLKAAFSYLKANFNDEKPEPRVPPEFLQGGCTPPG